MSVPMTGVPLNTVVISTAVALAGYRLDIINAVVVPNFRAGNRPVGTDVPEGTWLWRKPMATA